MPAQMILLNTLGPLTARIDDRRVPSNSDLLTGALLFLVTQRGAPVRRQVLVDLFFPAGSSDASRQLVYRLRHCGVEIDSEAGRLQLPASAFAWDLDVLLARGVALEEELAALQRGYLADYRPRLRPPYLAWVEEHRNDVTAKLRELLVRQIQDIRKRRDFRSLGAVARACLALDPLNEEATLALAESLAAVGAKADALQVLTEYMDEVGTRSPELRIAPSMLRERISTYLHEPEREPIPLIGRSEELATVMSLIEQSAGRNARACLISGPGGIGKTRLVEEACRLAVLSGHAVVKATLSQYDVDRPFAILRDLGPALLDLKGALGAAPETLAAVRGLCGRGPSQYSQRPSGEFESRAVAADVQQKLLDLIDAVSEEQPLVIWVEDADRMDDASRELVGAFSNDGRSVCTVMTSRSPLRLDQWLDASPTVVRIILHSLPLQDAERLILTLFDQASTAADLVFTSNAVRIATGIPLFLHLLFKNYVATRNRSPLPETLAASLTARLEALCEPMKSVFDAVVVLASQSRSNLLEEVTELPRYLLLQALRSLEEEGFVLFADGTVVPSHDLLADAARQRMPGSVQTLLHRAVAKALQAQTQSDPMSVALHWEACGENHNAVIVLLESARTFTSIGRPHESIRLLHRARVLTTSPQDARAIDTTFLEACHAAAEDHAGIAVAERIGLLSGEGSDEHQVMAMELAIGAARSLQPFAPYLTRIAANQSAPPTVRYRAVRLLVILADDLGQSSTATDALHLVSDLPGEPLELSLARLIYETVFGSPDAAVRIADRIHEVAAQLKTSPPMLKAYLTASFALWRCGDRDHAVRFAIEGYELAHPAAIWSACTTFASFVAYMAWENCDDEETERWYALTDEVLKKSAGPDRGYQHTSLGIEMALDRADPVHAMALLNELETAFPTIASSRFRATYRATRLKILMASGTDVSNDELHALLQSHLDRRHLGFHDSVADTTIEALVRAGRGREAEELRIAYITDYRRDRFPISARFRSLQGRGTTAEGGSGRFSVADKRQRATG
jgi:DNA-binding SARP family transcriptional activator